MLKFEEIDREINQEIIKKIIRIRQHGCLCVEAEYISCGFYFVSFLKTMKCLGEWWTEKYYILSVLKSKITA